MLRLFMCLFAAAFLFSSSTVAQASDSAWDVRCKDMKEGKKHCELFQKITVKETNQRFVEVAIFKNSSGETGGLFILPLGLLVAKPVLMRIDEGEPMAFNFHTCTPAGCLARINVADDLINKMKKGNAIELRTLSQLGKPFSVKLSLAGFTKAHKEFMKK